MFLFINEVILIQPGENEQKICGRVFQCAMGKQAMGNIAYNQVYEQDNFLRI